MGTWGRFRQGSFPLTPTPLPGLGEPSDEPDPASATLAAACSPLVASPGGWAAGRRKAEADVRALGLCRPSQGKCCGPGEGAEALGSNGEGRWGGCAPSPQPFRHCSVSPHCLQG